MIYHHDAPPTGGTDRDLIARARELASATGNGKLHAYLTRAGRPDAAAGPAAFGYAVALAHAQHLLTELAAICERPGGGTYTREQVADAVNAGANLVQDELHPPAGDRDTDLINLVVNAALTLLDEPGLNLDEVIRRCYETDPAEVRGWWGDWS